MRIHAHSVRMNDGMPIMSRYYDTSAQKSR